MNGSVRVAAVGDLHCRRSSPGSFQTLFSRIAESADVLALCGDLTDRGLADEARILAKELQTVKIPKLAVLGNHDFESDAAKEVTDILGEAQVTVLDGTAVEIAGIGFAGAKGFAGGFGDRALQGWGEVATKIFVREAVDETLKLESALARLRTPGRVVLLHYAPVLDTVDGEPREIYPFLGSSRLEEPINRYAASVVFHGHAHHGQPEGKTAGGVPVYNVALPLLQRLYPDRSPFRVVEIPARATEPAPPPVTVSRDQNQSQ
jgi:Icc-related predicted phosphoesterase